MPADRRVSRRTWITMILAAAALFGLIGLLRWSLSRRNPTELRVVGNWLYEPEPATGIPAGTLHKWEFSRDGRFVLRLHEPDQTPREGIAGKWWVRENTLFIEADEADRTLASRLESAIRRHGTRIDQFPIIKLDDREFRTRMKRGEEWTWIRGEVDLRD